MGAMKISTKLSLGFFAITLAFVVVAIVTVWRIELVAGAAARMDAETQLLNLAATWQANVRQNSARSLAVAYSDGPSMLEFFKGPMEEVTRNTTDTQKAFLALAQDEGSKKRVRCAKRGLPHAIRSMCSKQRATALGHEPWWTASWCRGQ